MVKKKSDNLTFIIKWIHAESKYLQELDHLIFEEQMS